MRKPWIRLVIILGIVFLASIATTHIFAASTTKPVLITPDPNETARQAEECGQCHEMKPEVLTWQASDHDKFACTVCHIKRKASDYSKQHQKQSFIKPIKTADPVPVPNSVCLQCHSANRMVSPSGDLKIPHQKHLDSGVSCVTCHSGVSHGKIAERDLSHILSNPNDYDSWTPEVAARLMSKSNVQPSMWTCIDCHKLRGVTTKCGACHTSIPSLPSHDQSNWKTVHGKSAQANIQVCVECHANPDLPTFITPSTGNKAADFAKEQPFCYSCHVQRPLMHKMPMMPIHPDLANKKGIQNCLTCHDANPPQRGGKVPALFCNRCHWF